MSNLQGRIIIIDDDFEYDGSVSDTYSHYSVQLENCVVNDTSISFIVCPHLTPDEDEFHYSVTLRRTIGNHFAGTFTEVTDPDYQGEIKGELVSNNEKYLLFGTWIENDYTYTFWATINKTNGSLAPQP